MSDMALPLEQPAEPVDRPRLRLLPGGVEQDALALDDAVVAERLQWAEAEAQAWLDEADAEAEAILARADARAELILEAAHTSAGLVLAAARAQAEHLLTQAIRAQVGRPEPRRGWRRLIGLRRSR